MNVHVGDVVKKKRIKVGKFIRKKRELLKYSKQKLEEITKVSRNTILNIEEGVHPMKIETLIALADGLKFDIQDVLKIYGGK